MNDKGNLGFVGVPGVSPLKGVKSDNKDTLYAFYDLEKSPTCFDISVFLMLAENYRIKNNCSSCHVIIVPGSNNGFRAVPNKEGFDSWPINVMKWRLINLLPDCCWLLPSCSGVSILESRKEAEFIVSNAKHVYPENYDLKNPVERCNWPQLFKKYFQGEKNFCHFSAPEIALEKVSNWLTQFSSQTVTLNIRTTPETSRNSNLIEWVYFSKYLKDSGYTPIFVIDAETTLDPLPAILDQETIFPESNNIMYRMALYELSYMNTFVNNGVASLAWFNQKVNYIMYKILHNAPNSSEAFLEKCGFKIGENPPFANKHQKWVWNYDDNLSTLINYFNEMRNANE